MTELKAGASKRTCDSCGDSIQSARWKQCPCKRIDICDRCDHDPPEIVNELINFNIIKLNRPNRCLCLTSTYNIVNLEDNLEHKTNLNELIQLSKSPSHVTLASLYNYIRTNNITKQSELPDVNISSLILNCINTSNTYNLLCLDGGGLRGYFTLKVIQELKIDIKQYFSIAGTSIGGLLAFILLIKHSYEDILNLFLRSDDFFKRGWISTFDRWGIMSSKYDSSYIYLEIDRIFKYNKIDPNITFRELYLRYPQHLILTAYDYSTNKSMIFSDVTTPDFPVIHALKSTMAAPTYFDPYEYNNGLYVDGGLFANDPEVIALLVCRRISKPFDRFNLISIGTGYYLPESHGKQKYGMLSWLTGGDKIFDAIMNATTSSIETTASYLSDLPDVNRAKFTCRMSNNIQLDDKKIINELKAIDLTNDSNFKAFKSFVKHSESMVKTTIKQTQSYKEAIVRNMIRKLIEESQRKGGDDEETDDDEVTDHEVPEINREVMADPK